MAARITALRERRKGVDVELDGRPWRTLPYEVAVRAGLVPGRELDRQVARALARELRRSRALRIAGRALRARDHSARDLEERLARRSVPAAARGEALDTLARAGAIDDHRVAMTRAEALAARGNADSAIRADLERRQLAPDAVEAALAGLDSEDDRLAYVVARRGATPGTARYLVAHGFDPDLVSGALEAALGGVVAADD